VFDGVVPAAGGPGEARVFEFSGEGLKEAAVEEG
jgi:hypothetical protein